MMSLLKFAFLPCFGLALLADPPVVIKKTPAVAVSPSSGPEMFRQYCAACHGVDGKGHGPAASALKVGVPDLTVLTRNNQGKYPGRRVISAIKGDAALTAHGSKDMPVWGTIFHEMSIMSSESQVVTRLSNLAGYIETLQQK